MRIYYTASGYRSFARAAEQYRTILRQTETLTGPDQADIAILHCEPHRYGEIFARLPVLRYKYVIGCAVWESTVLPDAYAEGISLVQEVWTCSNYSAAAFRPLHKHVYVIPHVMARDCTCRSEDIQFVHSRIGYQGERHHYLAVTHIADRRKNIQLAIDGFRIFHNTYPNTRLIVKGFGTDPATAVDDKGGVLCVNEEFSHDQMNALYKTATAFISTHHAEGWGFGIADAVLFGLPVVATGYSGNLDYMDASSGFLIPAEEHEIKPEDRKGLMSSGMSWAYMTASDVAQSLLCAESEVGSVRAYARQELGAASAIRFDQASVGQLIRSRLRKIAQEVA